MEKNFDRSFEVVYSKIYDSCKQRLQEVKMSNNKFLLGLGIIFIIICLIVYIIRDTRIYVGITIFMSLAIFLGFMISGNIRYRKEYKQHVIEGLVKGYNERFYFDPKMGVPRMEYVISNFDRNFNEYYSEDRIYGRFEDGSNFQMSEVVTHYVQTYTDSEGNKQETRQETFRGMYGVVRLNKNIVSEIHIVNDSYKRRYDHNRVEMDSSEFEKYFDLVTGDKVLAMRIFTSDLLEKYLDIVRFNKNGFEVKIVDNLMFFRYRTNQLFEPPMFSDGVSKELLRKYYQVVYYPIEIIRATIEALNDTFE